MVFHVYQRQDIRRKLQESILIMGVRNPMTRINIEAKLLLNQKNYILKAKRITIVENDDQGKYLKYGMIQKITQKE